MASLLRLFCALSIAAATLINFVVIVTATEFKVGETLGWRLPINDTQVYSQWAANNRFRVGDSLYFEYEEDSVLVVNKWGYYHCNTSKPIVAYNNGKTVIKLDRTGPFYFISGAPDHCKDGQRVVVNVLALRPSPPSPPSAALPPQSHAADSPSPSPLASSSSGFSVALTSIPIVVALTASISSLAWVIAPYPPHLN
ncbi:PREDICTED: mavicyanin [Nelumbo nucifera]|uniref:Phytocyanin domain-containing protein n=2 Tax=Nelumbo nucifera TaxID=4432 RepID=A0A822Y310_NELNU|nr:PREDICTED: mavicyanin [Nelumbo nucifera]DAD26827.1 TPA_asm: hypothetical protein HUJ06_028295 [Nelumbo nucifera]